MSSCKRIIARLDVKGKRLIKGVRFEGLRVINDACDSAREYALNGVAISIKKTIILINILF